MAFPSKHVTNVVDVRPLKLRGSGAETGRAATRGHRDTTTTAPAFSPETLLCCERGLNLHMLEELNTRLLQTSREGVLNPEVRHLHATPAVNRDLKPGRRNATLDEHMQAWELSEQTIIRTKNGK
ncbi:hypothetical protein CRUP_009898 [Coryphaenoides rupestris]|nr:hypothetical protein CRUP_009898 [Coryphaenoides rupestris]